MPSNDSTDVTHQCAFDSCSNEWEEFAVARGEQYGLLSKLMVPVCKDCLESVGGNAEPLTFEAKND